MVRVSLLCLGDIGEALALRAILESMHYEARLIRAAKPEQTTAGLMRAAQDDVIILSAHAGPRGFYLGEFGNDVDVTGMDGAWLPVKTAFKGVTFRPDTVLISTACATRESGLAGAMFAAGGRLIAPNGYPDGKIIVPWIAACLLKSDAGLAEAVAAANTLVAPPDRFSFG